MFDRLFVLFTVCALVLAFYYTFMKYATVVTVRGTSSAFTHYVRYGMAMLVGWTSAVFIVVDIGTHSIAFLCLFCVAVGLFCINALRYLLPEFKTLIVDSRVPDRQRETKLTYEILTALLIAVLAFIFAWQCFLAI